MRFVLVALIAAVVLGSVAAFSRFQSIVAHRTVVHHAVRTVAGTLELELQTTFEPAADVFGGEPLVILVNGQPIHRMPQTRPGVYSYRIPIEAKWREGTNRVFVQVGGKPVGAGPSRAVHAVLRRGEVAIAEETSWSPAGEPVGVLLICDFSRLETSIHE